MAERRLGRGLEALLGPPEGGAGHPEEDVSDALLNTLKAQPAAGPDIVQLPPEDIRPNPFQPRHEFPEAALQSLAESIDRHGVLQPVIVRHTETGYELVAGERRWRAAMHVGLPAIPAVVRDVDETQMLLVALIENVQREDLNPIDRAKAYRSLCERFRLTQEQAASQVGVDRASLANYIRLLDLPEDVQGLVAGGQVSMGHARAILAAREAERQRELARRVVADGLSVRQVEALVADRDKRPTRPARRAPDAHLRSLEEHLMERLGTRVVIQPSRKKNSGRIVIEFYSNDDFERIMEIID